jgi:hypothetical protein
MRTASGNPFAGPETDAAFDATGSAAADEKDSPIPAAPVGDDWDPDAFSRRPAVVISAEGASGLPADVCVTLSDQLLILPVLRPLTTWSVQVP